MKNIQFYLKLVREDPHLRNLFNADKSLVEFPLFGENYEEKIFGKNLVMAHGNSLETRLGNSDEAKKTKPDFLKHLGKREKKYFYKGNNTEIQRPNQDMIRLIEGLGEIGKLENYLTSFLNFFNYNEALRDMAKQNFSEFYQTKRDNGVYGSSRAFKDALYEFSLLEAENYLETEGRPLLVSLETEKLAKTTN
ncbi:MAG: hypothetical protein ABEI74_00485 [Candidatus Pacearchaeota archaeon]